MDPLFRPGRDSARPTQPNHVSRATRAGELRRRLAWVGVATLLHTGCSGPIEAGPSELVGTWDLVEVDGQPVAPGVFLTYTFTETEVTVTSDLDCTERYSYTTDRGTMSVTVVSQAGSQCGNSVGDSFTASYSIAGDLLTFEVFSAEAGPGTLLFKRRQ